MLRGWKKRVCPALLLSPWPEISTLLSTQQIVTRGNALFQQPHNTCWGESCWEWWCTEDSWLATALHMSILSHFWQRKFANKKELAMGKHGGIAVEGKPVDIVRYDYYIQVAFDWLSVLFSNHNCFPGTFWELCISRILVQVYPGN